MHISSTRVATTLFVQDQSPLFRLPAELRAAIYIYALTADRSIKNPATRLLVADQDKDIPPLGINLLQTCHRIYNEVDGATLYECNVFYFSRPILASWFFDHLSPQQRAFVHHISCDLGLIRLDGNSMAPGITSDWTHYLSCTPETHDVSQRCIYQPEMLAQDAPNLARPTLDAVPLQEMADRAYNPSSWRSEIRPVLQTLILAVMWTRDYLGYFRSIKELHILGKSVRLNETSRFTINTDGYNGAIEQYVSEHSGRFITPES